MDQDDKRWQQTTDMGISALSAAMLADPDLYPQPDDYLARLDQEQRTLLAEALEILQSILDGMEGAS